MPDQYDVRISSSAERALRKLEKRVQRRLVKKLRELAVDPRPSGVRKLSDEDAIYRVRVGDYRILYQIQDAALVVLVVDVGHRRDIYR